jgi:hypothetical protein
MRPPRKSFGNTSIALPFDLPSEHGVVRNRLISGTNFDDTAQYRVQIGTTPGEDDIVKDDKPKTDYDPEKADSADGKNIYIVKNKFIN